MALFKCNTCSIEFKTRGDRFRKYCSRVCYGKTMTSTKEHFYFSKLVSKRKRHETISVKDCLDLLKEQNGMCALTAVPLTFTRGEGKILTNASLDRIIAGGPYTKDNVRLTCVIVNLMRLDNSDEEFKYWCRKVLDGANS
jgi:hypothetical protein